MPAVSRAPRSWLVKSAHVTVPETTASSNSRGPAETTFTKRGAGPVSFELRVQAKMLPAARLALRGHRSVQSDRPPLLPESPAAPRLGGRTESQLPS